MTTETIIRLAGRGDGVTESGRYVALAAPGDVVDEAGIVTHGPFRVAPACVHFPSCGGCQLQHIDDATYAAFLTGRIAGALAAQGIDMPDTGPAHLSPPGARRRVSLRAERRGKRVTLGFNEEKSHRVIDLSMCAVADPALVALFDSIRRLMVTVLPDRKAGGVQMTRVDQGVDLALTGVEVEGLAATEALTDFAARHALARLTIDDGYGPSTRWEPEAATITLGDVPVPLPPAAFLQATADGEAALTAEVRRIVGDAKFVADLFAGLGTFALPLSKGAKLLAVEGARDAVLALKAAAGRAQRPLFVEHRDLFRRPLDAKELARFDAIVLDPPRAGAREQMPALATATAPVARIAYVSCNPATFARDARTLIDGGWRLERITPVGQFRWSTHVELVAAFAR